MSQQTPNDPIADVHVDADDEKPESSLSSSTADNNETHSPMTPVKKKRIYRKRKQTLTVTPISGQNSGTLMSFLQTMQGTKSTPQPATQQPVKRSREWGIFCFENSTDKSVYWGIKGLHVKWIPEYAPSVIPSPFGANDSNNTYNYYYNLSGRRNSTFSPSYETPPSPSHLSNYAKRHSSSGGGAWGNIVRYKLLPNTFCMGNFPLHPYSDHFILLVELHDNEKPKVEKKEKESKDDPSTYFPPTQTAIDGVDDVNSFYHPNKPQRPIVCKSFLIEHKHVHDVIIAARVAKSLFLFTDYQSLSVEPITYRFFPTYKPCELGPQIKLNHNIAYEGVQTATYNRKMPQSPIQTTVTSFGTTPPSNATPPPVNNMQNNANPMNTVSGSISLYEDSNIKSLRDNIMFYLLYLHKLRKRANLLIIIDDDDFEDEIDDTPGLYNYMMRSLLRSDITSDDCNEEKEALFEWFKQCVKLSHTIPVSEIKQYVLKFNDTSTDRSLQLYRCNRKSHNSSMDLLLDGMVEEEEEDTSEPWTHIEGDIDGIILLSTMDTVIPNELQYRLRSLEGFPTLFVFYGLEKCTDIYEAIRQKEKTTNDILRIYSSTHKPFIVHYQALSRTSQQDDVTICKFFREALDISLERVLCAPELEKIDIVSSLKHVMSLFQSTDRKIEIKDLQEFDHRQKSIWLFGLDNEKDSVLSAVNSVHYCCLELQKLATDDKRSNMPNMLICIRSREQFVHGKEAMPRYGKRSNAANGNVGIIRRNLSELWGTGASVRRKRKNTPGDTAKQIVPPEIPVVVDEGTPSTPAAIIDQPQNYQIFNLAPDSLPDYDHDTFHYNTVRQRYDNPPFTQAVPIPLSGQRREHTLSSSGSDSEKHSIIIMDDEEEESAVLPSDLPSNKPPPLKPVDHGMSPASKRKLKRTPFHRGTISPISRDDVVVLCVELSGRALISGEGGLFTTFLQEVNKYTKNVVLFVDRLDRNDDGKKSTLSDTMTDPSDTETSVIEEQEVDEGDEAEEKKEIRFVYGDKSDMIFDEELQNAQSLLSYLKHRFVQLFLLTR